MEWPAILIDIAMLGVLALSIVVGLMRGLVFEVLSLVGWFAAGFGAAWLGPWIAPSLPVGADGSALNRIAAFACAFIVILIVWAIGTRIVAAIVGATPLRPIDRVLGAGFGAMRGVVVLLIAAMVVSWTPLSYADAWKRSLGAQWLDSALQALRSLA